jgi:uncharacterized protein
MISATLLDPPTSPAAPTPADSAADRDAIRDATERACARIAPTWPLDRFIAVNPLWSYIERPLRDVAVELTSLGGGRLVMPREWFREHWQQGRFGLDELRTAIAQTGTALTEAQLLAALDAETPAAAQRPRLMDVVDAQRAPERMEREMSWRDFIVHRTSQLCASFFEHAQAQLAPIRDGGLYATWRRQALLDRGPAVLMGMRNYRAAATLLPERAEDMIERGVLELAVAPAQRERYLACLLLDVQGWASWCAYQRWSARLAGADDPVIVELLAIRVAWEWTLLRAGGAELAGQWRLAMASWPRIDALAEPAQDGDWVLQRALELAWQRALCNRLGSASAPLATTVPSAQAVFCIDVRSEVYRRALEQQDASVQTLGFAGFFGLPIEHLALGAERGRPQLPGLLAPAFRATDQGADDAAAARRRQRLSDARAWSELKTSPLSSFAFVEALGLTFVGKLLDKTFGRAERAAEHHDRAGLSPDVAAARKPRLSARADGSEISDEARCQLAEGMLRAMSLTRDFARVVLLVGHGSETRNNPHAAGLDCGACGGQTGEVNARVAAALLNDAEVRAGLERRGVAVPATTRFVPALHNTTTDELSLFDLDEVPASHAADVAALRATLAGASARARRARAPKLGLAGAAEAGATDPGDEPLRAALLARSRDWAEVRPEWGLAGNAALVIAPRQRTRQLDLEGRVFLHDYRHDDDREHKVLELLMTAPMVVAHWINFQYYTSTVDNPRYGSGNKVLHNVVGGHLGIFEGNGGDLRVGLPLQSLHDGERWMHEPLRLSVFIEAPRAAIEEVLAKHANIRALVDNQWLYLFALEPSGIAQRRDGRWQLVDAAPAQAPAGERASAS